eukprot:scaffold55582_cov47-Prasinocladus_malaysianus.AAC.3
MALLLGCLPSRPETWSPLGQHDYIIHNSTMRPEFAASTFRQAISPPDYDERLSILLYFTFPVKSKYQMPVRLVLASMRRRSIRQQLTCKQPNFGH